MSDVNNSTPEPGIRGLDFMLSELGFQDPGELGIGLRTTNVNFKELFTRVAEEQLAAKKLFLSKDFQRAADTDESFSVDPLADQELEAEIKNLESELDYLNKKRGGEEKEAFIEELADRYRGGAMKELKINVGGYVGDGNFSKAEFFEILRDSYTSNKAESEVALKNVGGEITQKHIANAEAFIEKHALHEIGAFEDGDVEMLAHFSAVYEVIDERRAEAHRKMNDTDSAYDVETGSNFKHDTLAPGS
ncbi:MAG: hypothetical protein KTR28_04815 [Micavibrio sp.]|nr:hypothetical protein [Micavibrio sp.]